ncbi:hypothetical protein PsorP6_005221 [Peronosclerospora sorghi]|uniref:Uncharacterized protein n=1 Tax=Peronosclerospora sorghi TaxID=230839 RepID=A0ACC0W7G2_9STRA|nr:hypothetical protein PsorP6_005221 [Peronosclerospora sorghi]
MIQSRPTERRCGVLLVAFALVTCLLDVLAGTSAEQIVRPDHAKDRLSTNRPQTEGTEGGDKVRFLREETKSVEKDKQALELIDREERG